MTSFGSLFYVRQVTKDKVQSQRFSNDSFDLEMTQIYFLNKSKKR